MTLAGCQAGTLSEAPAPEVAAADPAAAAVDPATMPPWAARDLEAALAAGRDRPPEPETGPFAEDAEAAADGEAASPPSAAPGVAAFLENGEDAGRDEILAAQAEAVRAAGRKEAVAPRTLALPEGQDWRGFAVRLLAAGRPGMALKAYERALVEEGADPALLTGAGIAAMGEGQEALAERYLDAALAEAPQNAAVNLALGRLKLRQGRLEPARVHFRTAFLVTSGQNELAVASLEEVDRRIARRRALYLPTQDREQAVTLSTLRTGQSTYLLGRPATDAETRAQDLEAAAMPPDAAIAAEGAADEPAESAPAAEDTGGPAAGARDAAADDAAAGERGAAATGSPDGAATASTDTSPDGTVATGEEDGTGDATTATPADDPLAARAE